MNDFRTHIRLITALVLCGSIATGCSEPETTSVVSWPLACEFASFDSSPEKLTHCANRDDGGTVTIRPDLLAGAAAGPGVQTLLVDGSWFFANGEKAFRALTYDNGADYFQEGLARIVQNGKIGFVNEQLEIVVAPDWDFAFPFDNGVSLVCTGCSEKRDGEHTTLAGGGWGYVDTEGVVVVEPVHDRDALPALPK